MKKAKFPVRLHGYGALVAIQLPEPMGGSAKIYLRNVAKARLPELYHAPIETGISGRTDSGEEIPINSVGRWLFGTPGYMGHVRVSNWEGDIANVEFPADSPSIVHELVHRLKAVVEGVDTPRGPGVVLERAMRLVKERRPDASIQKKAAFANSVQYLVTGWSGGFGGPSVREHAASYLYGGKAGRYTFGEAADLLLRDDGQIFVPITDLHRSCCEDEYCFDDDPSDVEQLTS